MSDTRDIVERLDKRTANAPHPAFARDIGDAAAEIRALRSALRECADDLAAEIDARYPAAIRAYPSNASKYDRDMEPVNRARALLTPTEER